MKKHVKSFNSPLLLINEEEIKAKQSKLFLEPEEIEELAAKNKEIVKSAVGDRLEKKLMSYWQETKRMEQTIVSLKNLIDESYKTMISDIETAMAELEKHGIEIKAGNIEFDNIVLKISEKQKMYHLSDEDKLKLFEILEELEEKKVDTIKKYARSYNMINEYFEYAEMGLFFKVSPGSERAKEPYFRHMEIKSDVSESVDLGGKIQNVITKVVRFLKNAWGNVKKYGASFGLEQSISEYKTKLAEAKTLVDSL